MGRKSLSERTDLVKVHLNPENDMTGRSFGEWNVLEYAGSRQGPWFRCKCSCGFIGIVKGLELRRGSMSCGHNGTTYKHGNARRKPKSSELQKVKHGFAKQGHRPAEYSVWVGMRVRCNDSSQESYANYGARGIKVCQRWDDFSLFFEDMGSRPTSEHTIERIDNDGDYEPNNCRWATRAEQARNNRRTILLTFGDETACLKDWCEHFGISYNAVVQRIKKGQDAEEAFTAILRKEVGQTHESS